AILKVLIFLMIVSGVTTVAEPGPAPPISSRAQERLEREVRSRLLRLPYYGVFDYIAFQVHGYEVTLEGSVTKPVVRHYAEAAVRPVEGIERLTNRIEVLPLSPNDNRLRMSLYRAIYGHTVLNRYALNPNPPIRIVVKNGNVTLEGVVLNASDRNIAFLQANGVPGVFSVRNHLRTEK